MPETRPLRANDPREVGGFRLTARIGEGAQGSVFLGESGTGERVAVKLLHADFGRDPRARTAFDRELAAARRVAPFCTAPVLAATADGDTPHIVSEYIDGPSLRDLIAEHGVASPAELVRLAIGTATALAAIHEAGVVHRDFKPANVLLGPDGPKVIDFGIARPLDATSATMTGAVGTPSYMAPEQVAGSTGGAPLDMFAWGCTMAFAANGAPPFGNDSVPAIMQRVLYGEPELGALTGQLRELVASCLAKDPASRPAATRVLRRLLGIGPDANLLAEGTSAAGPTGTLRSAPPPAGAAPAAAPPPPGFPHPESPQASGRRRGPLLIAGAAATALVLAGGLAAAILLSDGDGDEDGGSGSGGEPVAARTTPATRSCSYPPATGEDVTHVGTPPTQLPATQPTRASIKTNLGTLELELDAAKAPCTVNSIAYLAGRKFYDGTSCLLSTGENFKVLECGDATGTGHGGPSYQLADENLADGQYDRGTVVMGNAEAGSNGSRFIVFYGDPPKYYPSYTVFGRVTSGMDIVDRVAKEGTKGGLAVGDPKQKFTITEFRTSAS